ncbi:MAG: pantoate--beta-alanine ligase [Bacteroidia bacterium]|nr:pantoate--beta-alanine ligase [Bacteroidia bacterium]
MLVFTQIGPLKAYLSNQKPQQSIGFVPTMGALHAGHLSLVQQSKASNDLTVASIFVNPTQFNNPNDLAHYPRTLSLDMILLEQVGCDVLFCPHADEVYESNEAIEQYNWGAITHSLEGAYRPGHFDGVITIVRKLFSWVRPTRAYFGKKDYQQCAVIKELVNRFHLPIMLEFGETLREVDGLAMSSRNTRLSVEERQLAVRVSKALFEAKANHQQLASEAHQSMATFFEGEPLFRLEYIAIVDQANLTPLAPNKPTTGSVALIAVWCGNVRLIDSMILQ